MAADSSIFISSRSESASAAILRVIEVRSKIPRNTQFASPIAIEMLTLEVAAKGQCPSKHFPKVLISIHSQPSSFSAMELCAIGGIGIVVGSRRIRLSRNLASCRKVLQGMLRWHGITCRGAQSLSRRSEMAMVYLVEGLFR